MGQAYDVAGHAPDGCPEAEGVPQGGTLSKRAMRAVEARLERHPALPYWDMLIRPTSTS
jgi:hypothetical protein